MNLPHIDDVPLFSHPNDPSLRSRPPDSELVYALYYPVVLRLHGIDADVWFQSHREALRVKAVLKRDWGGMGKVPALGVLTVLHAWVYRRTNDVISIGTLHERCKTGSYVECIRSLVELDGTNLGRLLHCFVHANAAGLRYISDYVDRNGMLHKGYLRFVLSTVWDAAWDQNKRKQAVRNIVDQTIASALIEKDTLEYILAHTHRFQDTIRDVVYQIMIDKYEEVSATNHEYTIMDACNWAVKQWRAQEHVLSGGSLDIIDKNKPFQVHFRLNTN